MDKESVFRRADYLLDEVSPIAQHPDIDVFPFAYLPERDTLYLEVIPGSPPRWADTAYMFAKQEGMKYDHHSLYASIDGQPRVSYSGLVFVRFVGDFMDGSKVAFNISSQQPSHRKAEEQLGRYYSLFHERDGLEPIEVFRKFMMLED